jgi:hypothetical protein
MCKDENRKLNTDNFDLLLFAVCNVFYGSSVNEWSYKALIYSYLNIVAS